MSFLSLLIPPQIKATIFSAKFIIVALLIGSIMFGIWLFYHNYTVMVETVAIQQVQMSQLKNAVKTQQDTIIQVQNDAKLSATIRDELSTTVNKHEAELNNFDAKFTTINRKTGEILSLSKLAQSKPLAIQRIINEGTVDSLRCIEIASGAPLTQDEINAKKPSEINSSCPDIANPNFIGGVRIKP